MKKYIIGGIAVLVFIGAYYFTGSWKLSVIILVVVVVYLAWLIRFELDLSDPKSNKENIEKMHKRMKKEFIEKTEDNPTLR